MRQRIAITKSRMGTRIGYAVTGSGPPLVYVSGWIGHLELSWALPAERAFYEALADGRTLIRYDKPGCGVSRPTSPEVAPEPYTMEQERDALQAVVAATGVEHFDLMGVSLGAAVAATWAAQEPETVSRLVLYGGWPSGRDIATQEVQDHVLGLVQQHWGLASDLLADIFTPDADAATRAAFTRYQREAASADTARAMLELAYRVDVRDLLPRVGAPGQLVWREVAGFHHGLHRGEELADRGSVGESVEQGRDVPAQLLQSCDLLLDVDELSTDEVGEITVQ